MQSCEKESLESQEQNKKEEITEQTATEQQIRNFTQADYVSLNNENIVIENDERNDELDPLIEQAIANILEQNEEQNFIPYFVKIYGYPMWDFSYLYESDDKKHKVFFTPVAKLFSTRTDAFLFGIPANDKGDFHFVLTSKKMINNVVYKGAKEFENFISSLHTSIYMDKDIFDNINREHLKYFKEQLDDLREIEVDFRGQTVSIEICKDIEVAFAPESEDNMFREIVCTIYSFSTCQNDAATGSSPGGISGSCMNCGGGGGGASSGGNNNGSVSGIVRPDPFEDGGATGSTTMIDISNIINNTETTSGTETEGFSQTEAIIEELGLNEDLAECLANAEKFVSADILNLLANNAVAPCQPNLTTNALINQALENMCNEGGSSSEDFMGQVIGILSMTDTGEECVVNPDGVAINPCEIALATNPLHNGCIPFLILNKDQAFFWTNQVVGNNNGATNGCADAFRHAFFNAINARDCGFITAQAWGIAHECEGTDNPSLMDLANNSVGHLIGVEGQELTNEEIADNICQALTNGDLVILSDVADSSSEIISSEGCVCNN